MSEMLWLHESMNEAMISQEIIKSNIKHFKIVLFPPPPQRKKIDYMIQNCNFKFRCLKAFGNESRNSIVMLDKSNS